MKRLVSLLLLVLCDGLAPHAHAFRYISLFDASVVEGNRGFQRFRLGYGTVPAPKSVEVASPSPSAASS